MDKMLVSPDGDVIITNDGATILEKMEVCKLKCYSFSSYYEDEFTNIFDLFKLIWIFDYRSIIRLLDFWLSFLLLKIMKLEMELLVWLFLPELFSNKLKIF